MQELKDLWFKIILLIWMLNKFELWMIVSVPGDKSALNPSGIRLGTPALTTRGLVEEDMDTVADFIHQGMTMNEWK